MQVIGAGLGRTGTNSLKVALEVLLNGPCYHMFELWQHPEDVSSWQSAVDGQPMNWQQFLGNWVATVDWPGAPLFDFLRGGGHSEMLEQLGATIRRIHSTGISHGDLTTHNILWDVDKGLSIIDFGLSQITDDIEPLGLDLQVLNECLKASHPNIEGAIERVLTGYLSEGGQEVVNRFNDIRGRVRYHG